MECPTLSTGPCDSFGLLVLGLKPHFFVFRLGVQKRGTLRSWSYELALLTEWLQAQYEYRRGRQLSY
jgi:hypothetical protein